MEANKTEVWFVLDVHQGCVTYKGRMEAREASAHICPADNRGTEIIRMKSDKSMV